MKHGLFAMSVTDLETAARQAFANNAGMTYTRIRDELNKRARVSATRMLEVA